MECASQQGIYVSSIVIKIKKNLQIARGSASRRSSKLQVNTMDARRKVVMAYVLNYSF
jgi:hypothetical protein